MDVKHTHQPAATEKVVLPPILERHMDFSVWLTNKVRKFPKDLRYSFGAYLMDKCMGVLDNLTKAYYQPDPLVRQACLLEASTGLEQLRLGLRMSVSLRVLNAAALYYATGCLVEEGKMLGGWIKKEYVKPNAPRYA